MIEIIATGILWGSLALLAYSYLAYPLLVVQLARFFGDTEPAAAPEACALPGVTVIVAAFNEEAHIAARIANLLGQDYPQDRLRVLVGSDGCTDRTVALARGISDPRLLVEDYALNRGKASVLNDLVAQADSEILVFTDANTVFREDTVRQLVAAMDEGIAAVCGDLVLQRPAAKGSNSDHVYWSAERRLKLAESAIGGLLGANGGVYAIRRACFQPLRADTICDDFVIAMDVAQAGGGLKYAPAAVAFEDTPSDVMAEFHRRARIGTGNYQALFRHPRYLLSGPWARRFTYFSHKILRWLTPHLLGLVLACSLLLAAHPGYLAFAMAQLAGYAAALAAFLLRDRVEWPPLIRAALFFAVLNAAFLVGFRRYVTADYRGSWRRTEREVAQP